MATVLAPSNPGVISDPRYNAAYSWVQAVQQDLNRVAAERNPTGEKVGNWKPVGPDIFDPAKHPRAFMPSRPYQKFGGMVGTIGGVGRTHQIG